METRNEIRNMVMRFLAVVVGGPVVIVVALYALFIGVVIYIVAGGAESEVAIDGALDKAFRVCGFFEARARG